MTVTATETGRSARTGHLAELVAVDLRGAAEGHCVRVNFLERAEAEAICHRLRDGEPDGLGAYVLVGSGENGDGAWTLTADRAIELRNRKRGTLCLFVPADLVDATISSLGNSFAEIDGRDLHRRAAERVQAEDLSPAAQEVLRRVRTELGRGTGAGASQDELLDLLVTAAEREQTGERDGLGLELWRVGLIADARPDFELYLSANRRNARLLARPPRLDAPFRDRIASLKAAPETARELEAFFARRPMHDIRRWSRDLAEGAGPTFDRWIFPDTAPPTDLAAVRVRPFFDAAGAVRKDAKLRQPDGPGAALLAPCGEKETVTVRWETEPAKPANVHAWQVTLVPTGGSGDDLNVGLELPAREAKGTVRTAKLKLDLEFDEPPEPTFCIRVVAIDESGNEVVGADKAPLADTSDEFYLVRRGEEQPEPAGQRRRTVATLAEGRLRAATESKEAALELTQPAWAEGRGLTYFTARVNERTLLNVAVSPLLLDLERRTIANPTGGGRWELCLDEVRPAAPEAVEAVPLSAVDPGPWADFWRARTGFFERLRRGGIRDVLEAAEWSPELTNAALRHGQAYAALLQALPAADLPAALAIDTLLVRLDQGDAAETANVILPTHPLRAAWLAGHAALLQKWEEVVLRSGPKGRSRLVDSDLVRDLRPTNMPAFVPGWGGDPPFVFFQDLGFFHGVALPAAVADPLRRYLDVARVLGFGEESLESDDRRPERLARHLSDFRAVHPYADPLAVALVNPDQGEFLAGALDRLNERAATDEEDAPPTVPAFEVTAYVLDEHHTALTGLDRLRTRQQEGRTRHATDHLQPALATSIRPLGDVLDGGGFRPAHVAIVSDLSQPAIRALSDEAPDGTGGSLSLYGLIARFVGAFHVEEEAVRWRYRLVTASAAKLEAHPAGPRFGETLIDLQTAILRGLGRALDPTAGDGAPRVPGLEVRLGKERVGLLDRLHEETDWVITLDRFFGVDYYDSPDDGALGMVAQRYLIDYSPEFTEGLGQRMIITTAWREEVAAILRRAMEEIGFAAVDSSVRRLLHYLKTVSGRLALQALNPATDGTAAVGLGAVTAWLEAKGRLRHAVLMPIDAHLGLFSPNARGAIAAGQRRCDLALFALRRGIVEASFIEVKTRRGPLGAIDDVVQDMDLQMQMTKRVVEDRFFSADRADGALQRAYLANVLRFYAARARRYGLLDPEVAATFLAHLAQLEKEGLDFRPSFEGFIVSLDDPGRRPVVQDNLTVTILTAADFERTGPELVAGRLRMLSRAASATVAPVPPETTPTESAPIADIGRATDDPVLLSAEDPIPPLKEETGADRDAAADGTEAPTARSESTTTAPPSETEEAAPPTEPRIVLGDTIGGGEIVWEPSVKGSPHLFITGIPGQGKSWTTLKLLSDLARQGVPGLVFDFHGQLGEATGPYVAAARPTVLDAAAGLPFSPFECTADGSSSGWNATALTVSEIFSYVCGLGDIQRDALFTCIRDAYRAYGFGPGGDPAIEPAEFPSLQDVLHRIEQAERQKRTQNLVPRCRPLLEMEIFRPPAGTRTSLVETIRGGLVVDLHNLASETLQTAAGAFLLRKVYRDMFGWGMADRLRLAIVLDEAHRLAKDVTLPKIMKEGRKFGVAVVVASQGLADFHPEVLGNTGTKIAFRANYPESRKVAGFFRARAGYDLVAMVERLAVGTALVQTPGMSMAARVAMRPPA